MCDPVTWALIIGAATTAAGTGLQYKASEDAKDTAEALRIQNEKDTNEKIDAGQVLQAEAAGEFGEGKYEENVNTQTKKVTDNLLSNLVTGFTDVPGSDRAPDIVKNAVAQKSGESAQKSIDYATALGNLRGFDQNMLNQNLNINRVGQVTSQLGGEVQGLANALGVDLNNIDPSSLIGDALVGFGKTALTAGATAGLGNLSDQLKLAELAKTPVNTQLSSSLGTTGLQAGTKAGMSFDPISAEAIFGRLS